jgi:protein-S-isoprenylcysteine O-methyltransferase Ste14
MREAPWVVRCLWVAFILCWLVLAQFNKKASRSVPGRRAWAIRLVIIVTAVAIMLSRRRGAAGLLASIGRSLSLHPGIAVQWVGVGLCLAGIGFAFWARLHIGRNWGVPMSLRQSHELVTSGPYAYVRHPIYSGIVLGMIGSILAIGLVWLPLFALTVVYFVVSARTEEQTMLAQFPDAYPAYRCRTKMLIPFVF